MGSPPFFYAFGRIMATPVFQIKRQDPSFYPRLADGASPARRRLALPRRVRKGHPDRSKWRDDLRVVPSLRRAALFARIWRIANRFLLFEGESQIRAAPAAKVGADGASPSKSRLALSRRSREGCPPRSNWRDDLRVVPSIRRAAPCTRSVRVSGMGGCPHKNGMTRRSSLQLSRGAAAPIARWVTLFVPNGGPWSVSKLEGASEAA